MAGYYDEMIKDNQAILDSNGKLLGSAIYLVVVTLLVAGVFAIEVG